MGCAVLGEEEKMIKDQKARGMMVFNSEGTQLVIPT